MGADAFTVLVVCQGNVNRSPLGAVLLERWVDWYLPAPLRARVDVTSAGLRAPVGARMGRKARIIAEALGADGSGHRATQITEEMIRAADLVLVSSTRQRGSVLDLVPGALRQTFTIREAGRIAQTLPYMPPSESVEELRLRVGALAENRAIADGSGGDDIVDPEGKDDVAYRLMAEQEVPPLARLAEVLFGMPPGEVAAYDAAVEAAEFAFGSQPEDAAGASPTRARGRREA